MTDLWLGVVLVLLGCYALKLAGLAVPGRVLDHPLVGRAVLLIPVGLLAALVAVQTFADGSELVLDARVPALVVAAILLWLRVPFLVMLVAAAATAALLRAL